MTDPDLDRYINRPEESASADVTVISRGITITAQVEVSDTYLVVVRPPAAGRAVGRGQMTGKTVDLRKAGCAR